MTYNTNQWIILNYPLGAGGKFLSSCFFQFSQVAHWARRSLTPEQTLLWYQGTLPVAPTDPWSPSEIDTPWIIPASRAWPRGENLSEHEFNQLLDVPDNQYLTQCWNNGQYLVDFWHKSNKPAWWTNAQWITIYIDDMALYKKLVCTKLFEYQPETNTVISHDQRPDIGRSVNQERKTLYKNQWKWNNVSSLDEFFDTQVTEMPWYRSWQFDQEPSGTYIALTELFDVDKLYNFLLQFEDQMNQHVNQDYIQQLHAIWHKSTSERLYQ